MINELFLIEKSNKLVVLIEDRRNEREVLETRMELFFNFLFFSFFFFSFLGLSNYFISIESFNNRDMLLDGVFSLDRSNALYLQIAYLFSFISLLTVGFLRLHDDCSLYLKKMEDSYIKLIIIYLVSTIILSLLLAFFLILSLKFASLFGIENSFLIYVNQFISVVSILLFFRFYLKRFKTAFKTKDEQIQFQNKNRKSVFNHNEKIQKEIDSIVADISNNIKNIDDYLLLEFIVKEHSLNIIESLMPDLEAKVLSKSGYNSIVEYRKEQLENKVYQQNILNT